MTILKERTEGERRAYLQGHEAGLKAGELVELTRAEVHKLVMDEAWNQGMEKYVNYSVIIGLEKNGVVFARRKP